MKIENQAMMFALLSKYTIEAKGEEGRAAIQEGMVRYGRERGARMAARAAENGDPVELWTNQAYSEWKPDFPGQMESGYLRVEPTLVSYISKCAWCEAWKKYGILEYGREYCVHVDEAVCEGFGSGAVCKPVSTPMSWGGERCEFDWSQPLTEGELADITVKKQELGTSAMRDFDYHTAHIYSTMTDTICKAFPDDSNAIISKAIADYIELFGQEDYDRLLDFSPADF